jgi:hypothetical protein
MVTASQQWAHDTRKGDIPIFSREILSAAYLIDCWLFMM